MWTCMCRPFVCQCSKGSALSLSLLSLRLGRNGGAAVVVADAVSVAARMGRAHIQIHMVHVLVPNWLVGCCKLKAAAGPLCRTRAESFAFCLLLWPDYERCCVGDKWPGQTGGGSRSCSGCGPTHSRPPILSISLNPTHRALWLLHSRQYRQNVKIFNPSSLTPCWARLADGLPKFISLLISPSREQQGLSRRGPKLNKIPSINANLIDSDWDLIISLNFLADFMWLTPCQLDFLSSFLLLSYPALLVLEQVNEANKFLGNYFADCTNWPQDVRPRWLPAMMSQVVSPHG